MISTNIYPKLLIDYDKLYENCTIILEECTKRDIKVAGVFKGVNGIKRCVETFLHAGCKQIATSRLKQIIDLKDNGIDADFLLIRMPMLSEISPLVEFCDCSLNTEKTVIEEINKECHRQGKTHGVILMADIGDLREGIWYEAEIVNLAIYIEKELKNIDLLGIGTDLGCYGSIKPTYKKLNELCDIAKNIENSIGRKLKIVSGGSTTSYPLVLDDDIPGYINHLRIGEGILLAHDLQSIWGLEFKGLHRDVFTLQAELIEVKRKPTYPVGEIFIDGFGNKPEYLDRGIRKRGILATGKLDFAFENSIFPRMEGVELVGSCSDHTIIDIEECKMELNVGDIIEFDISYPALMFLSNSEYIQVEEIR